MRRRRFLKLLSGSLAAACTALLAIPGARYIFATIRPERSDGKTLKRVARLADLPVGQPVSVAVTGARRDAWTTYPDSPLGQVWLIRRDGDGVAPSQCRVDAYSSVCPHLRCRIQSDPAKTKFVCPCHRGAFDLEGRPIRKEQLGYDNPAPAPLETFRVHVVRDGRQVWWVEVEYPV